MKLFIIALILASTSAMACPNLAGQYQNCADRDNSPTYELSISQSSNGDKVTYVMTDSADELKITTGEVVVKTYTDREITETHRLNSSCLGNLLVLENHLTIENNQTNEVIENNIEYAVFKKIKTGLRVTNVKGWAGPVTILNCENKN